MYGSLQCVVQKNGDVIQPMSGMICTSCESHLHRVPAADIVVTRVKESNAPSCECVGDEMKQRITLDRNPSLLWVVLFARPPCFIHVTRQHHAHAPLSTKPCGGSPDGCKSFRSSVKIGSASWSSKLHQPTHLSHACTRCFKECCGGHTIHDLMIGTIAS